MGFKPFRFGISFGGAPSRGDLVEMIKKAEDSGFEVVSTADHISSRLSVMPLLSTAAEVSSMRVSPMVIANDYRHPVVVARDAATLDILSEGRFELGIGTGWIEEQYRAVGLDYDDPKTRVDRFEEALTVVKGCWTGEPFTFVGSHYSVRGVTSPTPVQKPTPPLLVAGAGERMLRIAGREADIVGISPLGSVASGFDHFGPAMATSGDRIDDQVQWIREGAGAGFDEIEISIMAHHLDLADDVERTALELAASWGANAEHVLASPHIFLGSADRIRDQLEANRDRFGISYVIFAADKLESVRSIVSLLAGT